MGYRGRVRGVLAAVVAVAALVAAPRRWPTRSRRKDAQGRTITFDVRAPDVAVEWYANLLRRPPTGTRSSA